jgi:hypothetical protein
MKKLHEIVKERIEKEQTLKSLFESFETNKNKLISEINGLKRIEDIAQNNIDIIKVQLAETILNIHGDPYGKADITFNSPVIAELAINDIANNCLHMKTKYFGNKKYEGYYQRSNHEYGFGPKHGTIVDEIGLKSNVRNRELTDDEKDACIYYIKNYMKLNDKKI